jgi:hypothetical protein
MSHEVFDRNRSTVFTEIQIILAAKGKSRRRFRLMAVYEKKTGEMLAEVFRTSLGPAVVMTAADHGGVSQHVAGIRRDIAPLTGEPNQQFVMKCRSRMYALNGAHFNNRSYPSGELVFR